MPTLREPPPHLSLQSSYAVTPSNGPGQTSDSSPARPPLVVHHPLADRWSQTRGMSEETHPQIVDVTMGASSDDQPAPTLDPPTSPSSPSTELVYGPIGPSTGASISPDQNQDHMYWTSEVRGTTSGIVSTSADFDHEPILQSTMGHPPTETLATSASKGSEQQYPHESSNNGAISVDPPGRSFMSQSIGQPQSPPLPRSLSPRSLLGKAPSASSPLNSSGSRGIGTPPRLWSPSPLWAELHPGSSNQASPPHTTFPSPPARVGMSAPNPRPLSPPSTSPASPKWVDRTASSPSLQFSPTAARSMSPTLGTVLPRGESILSPRRGRLSILERLSPPVEYPNPLGSPGLLNDRGTPLCVDEPDMNLVPTTPEPAPPSNITEGPLDQEMLAPEQPTSTPTSAPTSNRPQPALRISVPEPGLSLDDDIVMVEREPVHTEEEQEAMFLEDENLTPLEKIYLFSKSNYGFHRTFISKQLPLYLQDVQPQEAVDYILPLLNSLGTDEDETVKEVFVNELIPIIWWFFTHCQIVEQEMPELLTTEGVPYLLVNTFTPLIGSLLLSANPRVGDCARLGLVDLLNRLHAPPPDTESDARYAPVSPQVVFEGEERAMVENEIIYGVVLGMARLDAEFPEVEQTLDEQPAAEHEAAAHVARSTGAPSPDSDRGLYQVEDDDPFGFQSLRSPPRHTLDAEDEVPVMGPGGRGRGNSHSSSPAPELQAHQRIIHVDSEGWVTMAPTMSSSPAIPEELAMQSSTPAPQTNASASSGEWALPTESDGDPMLDDASGEATVGRVASMSLVAALAANAQMSLNMQTIFISEVDRVGHDSVYWVRREASFAVGALAKVVPLELVLSSLLPLYEALVNDQEWHVRHSILFALPGILARVNQSRRRTLAVQSLLKLADDPSETVRSALLEVLGEVIYTFRDDPGGPPQELIDLFVPEQKDWHKSEELMDFFDSLSFIDLPVRSMLLGPTQPGSAIVGQLDNPEDASHLRTRFFKDPERPIVCAFNYPALTLVLGRERWSEIRNYYLHLTEDRTAKVRRTLAASLGEMANIIGPEQAVKDLVPVFWDAVGGLSKEEEDIRTKALEGLPKLLRSLSRAQQEEMAASLTTIWENSSQYWRQRELFAGYLGELVGLFGSRTDVVQDLMGRALRDEIAAVRDAAIRTLSVYLDRLGPQREDARSALFALATGDTYRRRSTFLACTLELVQGPKGVEEITRPDLWDALARLVHDRVVDVRIGVGRLVATACEYFYSDPRTRPTHVASLIRILAEDESQQVQGFVTFLLNERPVTPILSLRPQSRLGFATFSKPPHPLTPKQSTAESLDGDPSEPKDTGTTQTIQYIDEFGDDTLPTPPSWGNFQSSGQKSTSDGNNLHNDPIPTKNGHNQSQDPRFEFPDRALSPASVSEVDTSSPNQSRPGNAYLPDTLASGTSGTESGTPATPSDHSNASSPSSQLSRSPFSMKIAIPPVAFDYIASSGVTPISQRTPRNISPSLTPALIIPLPDSPMVSPYLTQSIGARDEDSETMLDYIPAGHQRRRLLHRLSSDSSVSVASC